jgi:hypothetical protein
MEVTLRISGGFAAGLRRPETCVKADSLAPEDRARLCQLLEKARAEEGAPAAPRRVPDAMSYLIIVDEAGAATELRGADAAMSPGFRALLDWIRQHTG